MPGPSSEKSPSPREGRGLERVSSGSVIGADRRRSGPSCVLPKGVPQGKTESGGIVLAAICWAPSAQRRWHPKEALYLPTFSHLLIVNKLFSLCLSLSLSFSLPDSAPVGSVGARASTPFLPPTLLTQAMLLLLLLLDGGRRRRYG